MNSPFSYRRWCAGAIVVVLILASAACSPFGRQDATEVPPTETSVPTETPIPAVPTHTSTPTKVVEPPTATPEPTSTPAEPAPTETPTPSKAAGGDEEAEPKKVSYRVVRGPKIDNVIRNGSFEDGFQEQGLALQWSAFDNGHAEYTWASDDSIWHVSHGSMAQYIRIRGPIQPDRFVGIYQTVDVVAGEVYTLALHGVVRSSTADDLHHTPYGHRVQWAIDYEGGTDWPVMNADWGQWTDPGWNDVRLDEDKPVMNVYVKEITPTTDKLTLYIRGWTKWPILNSQAQYYVDGVFLKGPVPGEEVVEEIPTGGGDGMPTTGGRGTWIPVLGAAFVLSFGLWELRKVWRR